MKIWRYAIVFLLLLNVLVFYALVKQDDNLHLVFCDVGQGDGILIYKKNIQIVIDGGPDRKILSCLGSYMPFYDRTIEYVVLTNSDADHYGGLIDVFKRYKVLGYGTSGVLKDDTGFKELMQRVEDESIESKKLSAENILRIGDLHFETFWPERSFYAGTEGIMEGVEVNTRSIVLELQYGLFRALLTGDIVPPSTDYVAEAINTSVAVLKVPHHGSKNGLTEKLLEVTKPKVAVISAGKDNRYGHPHKEILDLLQAHKVKIYRTDLNGTIHIVTDGHSWRLE